MALTRNSDNVVSWIELNWKNILCRTSNELGIYFRMYTIARKLSSGSPQGLAWDVISQAAWSALKIALCDPNEDDIPPHPDPGPEQCQCVTNGGNLGLRLYSYTGGDMKVVVFANGGKVKEIIRVSRPDLGLHKCEYLDINGVEQIQWNTEEPDSDFYSSRGVWHITPIADSYCCDFEPEIPTPPDPPSDPYPFDDECNWVVTPIDAAIDAQGVMRTKYQVTGDGPDCGTYCYWETDAGPRICPDCDDCPEPFVPSEGGDCGDCNPQLAGTTYVLNPACDGEQGSSYKIEDQLSLAGIAARLDAIAKMIDASGKLKTPICEPEKPAKEGSWVTTRWKSEEKSSDSSMRLRKRMRYRSKSGRSDGDLAEYWEGFTWEAGPVCVIHKDAWWGVPQVWAQDADEGKRVIRFAGAEAGIDPDQDGEWEISGSSNPRLGRRGKMNLDTIEGFPWVSSRDGSNMLPMGGLDP